MKVGSAVLVLIITVSHRRQKVCMYVCLYVCMYVTWYCMVLIYLMCFMFLKEACFDEASG